MAFTSSDVAALEAAIASGELRVSVNGRQVEYRSIDDLIRARDLALRDVTSSQRSNFRRVVFKNA